MTTSTTGATYLMTTDQTLANLNSADSRTSSIMTLGLMIQPTKMQVRSAAMGIMTELEMKSKKSRMLEPGPSGSMNAKEL